MANIVVPELSESVVEATVAEWLVAVGDSVDVGDVLVVLETDKVALEVTAEVAGAITEIAAGEDEDVVAGQLLGTMSGEGGAAVAAPTPAAQPVAAAAPAPVAAQSSANATPVARNVAREHGVDIAQVPASNGAKVDKADVLNYVNTKNQPAPAPTPVAPPKPKAAPEPSELRELLPYETREKMSRRRRTIARNLVKAQQTAAMLTTFNEVDMTAVMEFRKRRKEHFKEKYGVSLGINSFFVKAAVGALKNYPRLNAEIDQDTIISKDYFDIGIAVGSEEGLVVPVLRNVGNMTMFQIERKIKEYAVQVMEGTLPLEALRGGSFTITNGGVFGSLMSTPILNYPQVAILGLHGIKERPVAIDGGVAVRPMMYTALTYDHRIVDGREAVQFLVRVKELIEDPETLLIEG